MFKILSILLFLCFPFVLQADVVVDSYSRDPAGDPINAGLVEFTWQVSGETILSVNFVVLHDAGNIVSDCINVSPTDNSVVLDVPAGVVEDTRVVGWATSGCSSNFNGGFTGDAFVVDPVEPVPVLLFSTTTPDGTADVVFHGVLLFLLSMGGVIWLFSKKR